MDASSKLISFWRLSTGKFLAYASIIVLLLPAFLLGHSVGEPALERELIWRQCCNEHDCIPQQVNILGGESNGKVAVDIEQSQGSISKEKFHSVPSNRTWVCYRDPKQGVSDSNIRCILYPGKPGV
jgi:hypothetical protein